MLSVDAVRAFDHVEPLCLDALMPALFLDDTYVVGSPERVVPVHGALSNALWARARVQLNQGKTRGRNAAREELPNLSTIQPQQSTQGICRVLVLVSLREMKSRLPSPGTTTPCRAAGRAITCTQARASKIKVP